MNTHLKQLWAAMKLPEKLQKSYKFFCRGLDIRVTQTVEPDLFKLWMLRSPQAVPFCQQLRCDGQAIREPEQLPAVAVLFWGVLLVLLELFKPCLKFLFQRFGHIQDTI